jgi:hypothetical protein
MKLKNLKDGSMVRLMKVLTKEILQKPLNLFYKLNLIRLSQINLCQGGTKEFVFCKGSSNFFGE